MNLVDLTAAPIAEVITRVDREAERLGVAVAEIELVGLLPGRAFQAIPDAIKERAGWTDHNTVEGRLIELAEELPEGSV